jgi:HlyD family secretion protein
MKTNQKPIALFLTILLVATTTGCGAQSDSSLQASGIIEATEISVAPELSGRVVEVAVEEGDRVEAGDLLFRLDDSLLMSQREAAVANQAAAQASLGVAQAGVDAAQAQYDLALSTSLALDQANHAATLRANAPGAFDLPSWYFSQEEQIRAAQTEVDAAQSALEDARDKLADTEASTASADFTATEERLAEARAAYDVAKEVEARANSASDNQEMRDAAQDALDDAETELNSAQRAYDDALTTEGAQDVLADRAKVVVARERYYAALDALRALQTGSYSLEVAAAAKAVDQAKALLDQSQAAVEAAQASLALIDAQIEKLEVRASEDGTVLVRSIQPGEVVQAGLTALTIGQLDVLKVTVYLPEDRYGQVSLGDEATLSVDSFPGESFTATVTRVADQAEYTPRNVQTTEERQSTVYAVELTLENTQGKLKPGMQADISFSAASASN